MAEITFEELVRVAQQLSPEQKMALVQTLEISSADSEYEEGPTRFQLIAELVDLQLAGALNNATSMRNMYANPHVPSPSAEELDAYLREIGTEWEDELDELADDTN
jgi:hypothetical protein